MSEVERLQQERDQLQAQLAQLNAERQKAAKELSALQQKSSASLASVALGKLRGQARTVAQAKVDEETLLVYLQELDERTERIASQLEANATALSQAQAQEYVAQMHDATLRAQRKLADAMPDVLQAFALRDQLHGMDVRASVPFDMTLTPQLRKAQRAVQLADQLSDGKRVALSDLQQQYKMPARTLRRELSSVPGVQFDDKSVMLAKT